MTANSLINETPRLVIHFYMLDCAKWYSPSISCTACLIFSESDSAPTKTSLRCGNCFPPFIINAPSITAADLELFGPPTEIYTGSVSAREISDASLCDIALGEDLDSFMNVASAIAPLEGTYKRVNSAPKIGAALEATPLGETCIVPQAPKTNEKHRIRIFLINCPSHVTHRLTGQSKAERFGAQLKIA
jgi:hypothetical protein